MLLAADIVAETVGPRLERREGGDVGLVLRCIRASRREGNLQVDTGVLRGFFHRRAATEDDQVGKGDLLAELLLDRLQLGEHGLEFGWLIDFPVLLRSQTYPRAIRAAALVGAAERRGRRPGGRDKLGDRKARAKNLRLQRRNIGIRDQRMTDGWN